MLLVGLGQKVLALSLVARAFYSRSAFFFSRGYIVVISLALYHQTHNMGFQKHYDLTYVAWYGIIRFGQPHVIFDTFALFMPILGMVIVMIIWLHFCNIQTWRLNNLVKWFNPCSTCQLYALFSLNMVLWFFFFFFLWHLMLKQEALEPLFLAILVVLTRALKHGYSLHKVWSWLSISSIYYVAC